MARRYFICDVYGSGRMDPQPWGPTTGPYRPAIDTYGDWTVDRGFYEIHHTEAGVPLNRSVLVLIDSPDLSRYVGKPGVDDLPEFPLDGKLNSIANASRTRMFARLQARGINTTTLEGKDGYREVLVELGKLHNPAFNIDAIEALGR